MYAAMQRSLDERRQIPSICLYVRALRRRALWAACGAAARARGGEAVLRGDRVPSLEHLERREGPWAAVVAAAGAAAGTLPEIGPPLTPWTLPSHVSVVLFVQSFHLLHVEAILI